MPAPTTILRRSLLLALSASVLFAAGQSAVAQPETDKPSVAKYKPALSHITLTGTIEPATAAPGSVAQLTITAEPSKGWHIYALAEKDPKDVSKPTLIVLTDTSGLRYRAAKPDRTPIERSSTVNQAGKEQFYDKSVTWTIEIEVPRDAKPGKLPIAGLVGFQSCTDSECEMPLGARFEGVLAVGEKASNTKVDLLFRDGKYSEAAKLAEDSEGSSSKEQNTGQSPGVVPPTQDTQGSAELSSGLPFKVRIISGSASGNETLAAVLVSAFFGGLILNLMPCVLPVIGLKLLSFIEQSHHHRSRVLMLNVWYSLGLMSVFLVLATLASAARLSWGEQFTSATFTIVMSAVVFVMALSFLGVWEIPIPGFIGSGKAAEVATHEGAAGAFAKGVVSTVLAT